jgi:hypothetical protein
MAKQSALRDNGSTALWRKIRQRVLIRDQYICQYCGLEANTVDHVIERSLGGDDSMDNLVAACKACNYGRIGRKGIKGQNGHKGAFFESVPTPMTPLGSFAPRNGSISHYQESTD